MIGDEVAPGLWRWSAFHEDWKQDVGCVAIEREGTLVLVDPLLSEDQWPALERACRSAELHLLITIHWHARSAAQIAARFPRTRIWAYRRDRAPLERRTPLTDVFGLGDQLPASLHARPWRRRTEILLWDSPSRALIVGDALLGAGDGVRLSPLSWMPGATTAAEMRESLLPLLALPIERVLVSHGEPVLCGGREALAAALGAR